MSEKNGKLRFSVSKPWGYLPAEVDKKLDEYEAVLSEVNARYLEQRRINALQEKRIERLQEELKDMHLQMSFVRSGAKDMEAEEEASPILKLSRKDDDSDYVEGFEILT